MPHSKFELNEAGVYVVSEDMLCNCGARQPERDWPAALLINHPGGWRPDDTVGQCTQSIVWGAKSDIHCAS